jgi:RNA polymerase sigma-70 factor (ECF subfamily)
MDDSSNAPAKPSFESDAEQFLSRLIRRKARQIIGQAGFRPGDEADIEQQLRLKVAKHLSAYNDNRGHLYPFLTAVVERNVATILRDHTAEKRDPRRVVSLSVRVDVNGEGQIELGAAISEHQADVRLGRTSRSHDAEFSLQQDVDATIAKLPADEQIVCESLKYGSITDVAREMGIPRSTVYDMIARWRQAFQDEDLQEYL